MIIIKYRIKKLLCIRMSLNEYIAGAFTGLTQIAVGYPFDTIKVLLQNKQTLQTSNFNIKNLYRGVKYPFITNSIVNSTLFYSYHTIFHSLTNNSYKKQYQSIKLKYINDSFLSGFLSGIIVSPIIFISDIGKTTRQINKNISFHHMFRIKGLPITILRESTAYGLYFYTYDKMKQCSSYPLLNGAIAGLANWGLTYPIDVIKNRQVAQNIGIKQAFMMGHFSKGYLICLLRAFIVNGCGFYIYELSKNI